MKPWTSWLPRLGIAAACVMAVGCGGSGVPDPSADSQAASDAAPPPDAGGAPPPPSTPLTQGRKIAVAGAPGAPKADEAPAEETPAPNAEAEKTAPTSKAEGGSATAEMLALATNSNASGSSQPTTGTTPAASQGAPTPPMGSAMMQMMQTQGGRPNMGPGGPGPGGAAIPSAAPGGSFGPQILPGAMGGGKGGPNPSDMASMASQMQMQRQQGQGGQGGPPAGAMAQGGPGGPGMPGRPGGPGGPGGSSADDKPANFRTPEGAVEAFLSALRAKDPDRLAEATALRAPQEPPEKNRILFKKIFELSLSDSELDDLARKFEGYRIAGENPPKSTARVEVILQKSTDNGARYTLVVMTRHEKKGWGVLHLATPTEFKPLGQIPKKRTGGGR